jgi:hypothetical protein
MNHNEKIKFLKGLQRGERNVQELHYKDSLDKCTANDLNYILAIKTKLKNGIMPVKKDLAFIQQLRKRYIKTISSNEPQ